MDNIIVSPNGNFVAGNLQSSGDLIAVWDLRTRTILTKIRALYPLVFVPSPSGCDDYILVTMEQSLMVWDHSRGARVTLLPGYPEATHHTPTYWRAAISENLLLAWCKSTNTLHVWDRGSFTLVYAYHHDSLTSKTLGGYCHDFVKTSLDEKWLLAHRNPNYAYEISVWDGRVNQPSESSDAITPRWQHLLQRILRIIKCTHECTCIVPRNQGNERQH